MKIDDMVEQLQIYREEFGNIDVCIPEIIEESTPERYSRKTIFNNCEISVCSYEPFKLIVKLDKVIE